MPSGNEDSRIELLRGGRMVSTLTGAFGQSIRETRLTALLGYLIATDPRPFTKLFGFNGAAQRVCLETRSDDGRSDILIETAVGIGVIEAKVDATDPFMQSSRYPAKWRALLTYRVPRRKATSHTRYISWHSLADLLRSLSSSTNTRLKFLSTDLLRYLEEHRMVRQRESVEIYAREINESASLKFFLEGELYCCDYQAGSRLVEALYFAPHFGNKVATKYAGVNVGISYIARIEAVGNATSWKDFQELVQQERGRAWWNSNKALLLEMRHRYRWNKSTHRSILFLGKPRLVFNPPVRKEMLQMGKGWLSRRFLSFDELYAAWGT